MPALFDPRKPGRGRSSWNSLAPWFFFLILVLCGLLVRQAFLLHGYLSFNSDEAMNCEGLAARLSATVRADCLSDFNYPHGPRLWICLLCGWLAGGKAQAMAPWFCLVNVLLYLGGVLVLARHFPKNRWAPVPLLVFMALPAPCVAYLGTQASEIRSFYFYGLVLMFWAGRWLDSKISIFLLGWIGVKGCLDDPFTLFFLVPVLAHELGGRGKFFVGKVRGKGWALTGGLSAGLITGIPGLLFLRTMAQAHAVHAGLAPPADWIRHLKMLVEAWPFYWISALPWGYLQQSALGYLLCPTPDLGRLSWVPPVFWSLLAVTAWGAFRALPGPRWSAAALWGGPFLVFLGFFVFGAQSWDVTSFRYLGFGQLVPAFWLGIWAARGTGKWGKGWVPLLTLWAAFNAWFLWGELKGPAREHPARHIAVDLERIGIRAGFANYWVSEAARYFSDDAVLLSPYSRPPVSRRTIQAAQESPRIGLVWVDGLDRPAGLPEITAQLRQLHYVPVGVVDFKGERWRVYILEKRTPGNPGHSRTGML